MATSEDAERRELHAELLARAAELDDLEAAQIEGWVSALFAVLDDEISQIDFLAACRAERTPAAAVLAHTMAILAGEPVAQAARETAQTLGPLAPDLARTLGTARCRAAWKVVAPFGTSIVLGWRHGETEEHDHGILVEIDDDRLVDIQLVESPVELLDAAQVDDERVEVEDLAVEQAIDQVVAAWTAALSSDAPVGSGIAANQWLVRARIRGLTGSELPLFRPTDFQPDVSRGMSDEEIAEADAAARSTLVAALGDRRAGAADPMVVNLLRGQGSGVTAREADALLWLEWADWLGVVIGLVRQGDQAPVDGERCVELVNRCPEVSSTIDRSDREYAIWAFEVAIDHLIDAGLVVDGLVRDGGTHALWDAALTAWSR